MSKMLKVSDDVYEMLRILKPCPSASFSDVIIELIRKADPELLDDWIGIMDERADLAHDGVHLFGREGKRF